MAKKLTPAQEKALESLKSLNKPATSQDIGTQIKTLQALEKLGLVVLVEDKTAQGGRECEAILWTAL
ncbi:hypothetical protein [Vibrio gangliei]|uniref:hypothetical protein n=1 Tax=Vibrio gangliei TaxID=2077090 RepID=UPI000D021783|nr:hypothetical protein [Vibrio gangliei]